MKHLLYKELRLAKHPTMFLFLLFSAMLLIPSYPYYVAFIYTCLSVFFVFLQGRENNDLSFTALLPVRKRDIVRARCLLVVLMQLAQVLVSLPCAIVGARINPLGGNAAGIEANAAFFGLVLVMYALFNLLFLPAFYRTGYRVGRAFLFAGASVLIYIVAAELLVQCVPALKASLDTFDPATRETRLFVLLLGAGLYAAGSLLACRLSERRFARVYL